MLSLRGLRLGVRGPSRSTVGRRVRLYLWRRRHALSELQPRGRSDGAAAAGGLQDRRRQKGLATLKPEKGWHRHFEDPIPRGRPLVTLQGAGNYITKLPKAEHAAAEWQAATEALILVATRGGLTMFARIGVMRALNRHVERVFSDRKDTHWGKRKPARDR